MDCLFSRKLFLFPTVSALTFVFAPSVVSAQDTGASSAADTPQSADTQGPLGDIIVTARRREERLQDVPQAISVMTQDELRTQLVRDQNDLQQKVPSLSIAARFGHTGGTYAIRGLSGPVTGTPSVGTYFAEVPTPTNTVGADSSAGTALYDLQSVQVLKGPQGTLFGRSTTAGAVLVTPAAPNLTKVEGNGNLELGSLGYLNGTLAVSIPIINDVLGVRFAGNYKHRNGYTKIIGSDRRLDELNTEAQRVSVLFEPTNWFKNTTIYNRFHVDQASSSYITVDYFPTIGVFNPLAGPATFNNPNGSLCAGVVAAGLSPDINSCVTQRVAILQSIRNGLAAEVARTSAGGDALRQTDSGNTSSFRETSTHETVVNKTEITLPELGALELQLKNIFGYQKTRGYSALNVGGNAQDAILLNVGVGAGLAANQVGNRAVLSSGLGNKFYSNETQIAGTLYKDRLVFVAGYYYQYAPNTIDLINPGGLQKALGGVTTVNLGYTASNPFTVGGRAKQSAFYGQATLSLDGLLDGVHLTAGVRHTKDDLLTITRDAVVLNPVAGTLTPSKAVGQPLIQAVKTSGTNYNFSLDHKVNPGLLVYVTHRKGYAPGGINGNPLSPVRIFGPEGIKDLEAGMKWDFNFGKTRGRLNLAAYQVWYSNIQRAVTDFATTPNGSVLVSYNSNVADAKLRGIEVELLLMPTSNLTLGLNYSLNDTKYTRWVGVDPYNSASGNIDLSNNPFHNAPRHKLNVNATYDIPLSGDNGTVALTGQVTYQSLQWFASASNQYIKDFAATETIPGNRRRSISQEGYALVNARIDWRDPLGHKGVIASLFARNLLDKIYAVSATNLNNVGLTSKQFGEPRLIGASLSFNY